MIYIYTYTLIYLFGSRCGPVSPLCIRHLPVPVLQIPVHPPSRPALVAPPPSSNQVDIVGDSVDRIRKGGQGPGRSRAQCYVIHCNGQFGFLQ